MRISNCKGCGRIFNVLSDEQYCPNCQKKMDEKFDIVKRFVEDNPNVPDRWQKAGQKQPKPMSVSL